jgi:predicted metal-dependent HD superfamily phosphohydrolase
LTLQRWLALCDRLGTRGREVDYRAVIDGWRSWGRRYHTVAHLDACLQELDASSDLAERPAEVEFALWLHDAIYKTWRSDNERRSAAWAVRLLEQGGVKDDVVSRVQELVLATRHTGGDYAADAALVVDVDLSILGQPHGVYVQFEHDVRKEYWWVPHRRYAAGRTAILQSFLDRSYVYGWPLFRDRYEVQARQNLEGAIRALAA